MALLPDGAISMEQQRKDTANNEAVTGYEATLGNVSPQRTVLCFTIHALMKSSNGLLRSTLTPISLLPR
jgi:hypothetical protein